MNYHKELEEVLFASDPDKKIKKFEEFYKSFLKNDLEFDDHYKSKKAIEPSYEGFCKIVPPSKVAPRKHFDTKEGKIALLHTIAHIEYSAIDLALDAALRFNDMPLEYYQDWLEVADDEVRHFNMINSMLNELGVKYGDIPVHTNLLETMKKTTTLIERMAVVPRYLEANGLEQNPKIIKKLESNPDVFNKNIIKALYVILDEEVDHVKKGDKWFKYECKKLGVEPHKKYMEIIEKFYPGSTSKKMRLNFKARKDAGFSCDELKQLSKKDDCS